MKSRSQDPTAPAASATGEGSADAPDGESAEHDRQTVGEAFHNAQLSFAQLTEYARHFLSVKLDAIRLSIRNALFFAVVGVVGLLAASALIVTAVVYLVRGLAEMLTALFSGHAWAGDLVTALLLLGGVAALFYVAFHRFAKTSRERTVKKYAARQQQQRARFGEDASDSRPPVD